MTTPVNTVYLLARDLLETSAQLLADNSLHVPDHQFVSWQYPSWDCCNHLVVHFKTLVPTYATKKDERKLSRPPTVFEADLVVTYIGCAPVGDPIPNDDVIDDNARGMYEAAWCLYEGIRCEWDAESMTPIYGEGCRVIHVGQATPHPPMGGCESFEIAVNVRLS